MFKKTIISLALATSFSAIAADVPAQLAETLTKNMPGITIDKLSKTDANGLFELTSGNEVVYVTGDGKFLLQGNLINLETKTNLTEQRMNDVRKATIKNLSEKDLISFAAKGKAKHEIVVFTDPTCGYCQKLHGEIEELNKQGVTVKYAMFPRDGVESSNSKSIVKAMCDKNAKVKVSELMSKKQGESTNNGFEMMGKSGSVGSAESCPNAVSALNKINETANKLGVQGTPYIVHLGTGTAIPGYRPAADMVRVLDQLAAR